MKTVKAFDIHQDTSYINGIRIGHKAIIDDIYHSFFPIIKRFIVQHSGNQEDAKDIFQEALLVVFHKTREKDFTLTCKFDTYLKVICRNIWFKQLRDRKVQYVDLPEEQIIDEQELSDTLERVERYSIYRQHFQQITEKCRMLLELYLQGTNMETIAQQMGFASTAYARKRKFKCKEQLINRIEEDERFQKLMADV